MNEKRTVWMTSLLCLLPMIFSAIVYSRLPGQVAIHWNTAGEADNYVNKAIAAFGLPILFLAIHLMLTKTRGLGDPKSEGRARANATWQILVWTAPALSIVLTPITLLIALGIDIPMGMVGSLLVGVILIIIGNYLPKSRKNKFIGIKLPWTRNDEDNWNQTHRLAGYLYIACGVLLIVARFMLKSTFSYILAYGIVIALLALVPTIYSYSLYKRKGRDQRS